MGDDGHERISVASGEPAQPSAGLGQLQRWLRGDPLTERDDASADGAADGWAGGREAALTGLPLDLPQLELARQRQLQTDPGLHVFHLLSSLLVVVRVVLVDVVVEGAAGVG